MLQAGRSGVRDSAQARNLSLLQDVQTGSGSHPLSYSVDTAVISRGYSGRGVRLTPHPHLVLKFRMRGAMPVIPLYAIMAWTDCSVNFCNFFRHIKQHKILHLCYGYSLNVRGSSRFCTAYGMQHSDQFPTAGDDYRLMRENHQS